VLNDDEVRAVWNEAARLDPRYRDIVRLLFLTATRDGYVSRMRWDQLSGDTWCIPGSISKNKSPHDVHLVPLAREIIEGRRKIDGEREHVFTGRTGKTAISGLGNMKKRLNRFIAEAVAEGRASFGEVAWVLHDIRRTVATNLQRLGFPLPVTEAVLGHVSGSRSGIVGIYQRYSYEEEKRRAFEAWAERLAEIVSGKRNRKVVRLRA
jgi:integrase